MATHPSAAIDDVVALLPADGEFDKEAHAAAQNFARVWRYSYDAAASADCAFTITDETNGTALTGTGSDVNVLAVHRGYLVSTTEFCRFSSVLKEHHGIHLLTSAEQHERCTYYPSQHAFFGRFAPKCRWVSLDGLVPASAGEVSAARAAHKKDCEAEQPTALDLAAVHARCLPTCEEIVAAAAEPGGRSWRFCVLKDYAKSEKGTQDDVDRFLHAPTCESAELATRATDLAALRAHKRRLYRGIVFKEGVPLAKYPLSCACEEYRRERKGRGDAGSNFITNEWRLWYARSRTSGSGGCREYSEFHLLEACVNSFQDPGQVDAVPAELLAFIRQQVLPALGNAYTTVDVAETEDEVQNEETGEDQPRWILLEAGDGASSGPAPGQDMRTHWRQLSEMFGEVSWQIPMLRSRSLSC